MTCRRAAQLIIQSLDARLPFGQRLGLGLHVFLCAECRRFRTQMTVVEDAYIEWLEQPGLPIGEGRLSEECKTQLRQRIQSELDRKSRSE